jgi:pimeloyl-ACP methyl ester carboxylesterase
MKLVNFIDGYLRAIRFIWGCSFPGRSNVLSSDTVISFRTMNLDARVYYTKKRSMGTILAVHGMAPGGNRDQRMINACSVITECGYTVVAPQFTDIMNLRIKETIVDDIAGAIKALSENKMLCPSGKISIFAASFSACMSIIAASRKETNQLINSICAVGTFCDINSSFDFLLNSNYSDEYARLIFFSNFLHVSTGLNLEIERALQTALKDSANPGNKLLLPDFIENMSEENRDFFLGLLNNPDSRKYHWEIIKSRSLEVRRLIRRISAFNAIGSLKSAVALIHGRNDSVIPPTESIRLHQRLSLFKKPSRLSITPLISHGDAKFSLSMIPAVVELAATLAFFFRNT